MSVIGSNNVTVSYAGYDKYNPTNDTKTFEVLKKDCTITFNPINDVSYSDEAKLTGTLIDSNGNPLTNKALTIKLNNAKKYVRTDQQGLFSLNATVYNVGTNNVTVSYDGYGKYNPTNDTKSFEVVKKDSLVTINQIGYISYGKYVNITGTLKDGSGNNLVNRGLTVSLNGKNRSIRTDANGNFNYTTKTSKIDANNLTISYAGYSNYNPYMANKTFMVFNETTQTYSGAISNIFYKANLTTTEKLPTDSRNITEGIGKIVKECLTLIENNETITVDVILDLNKLGNNSNSQYLLTTFAGFDENNRYENIIPVSVLDGYAMEFSDKTDKNITYNGYMISDAKIVEKISTSSINNDVEFLVNSLNKSLKSTKDLLIRLNIDINTENPWTHNDDDDNLFVDV